MSDELELRPDFVLRTGADGRTPGERGGCSLDSVIGRDRVRFLNLQSQKTAALYFGSNRAQNVHIIIAGNV